jgi:hypothetical protein
LIEQPEQLHLSVDLKRAAQEAFSLEETPNVLFRKENSPTNVRQRNALSGTDSANLTIAPFDVGVRLRQKPVAEVSQNFVASIAEFLGGYFAQSAAPRSAQEFL